MKANTLHDRKPGRALITIAGLRIARRLCSGA